MKKFSAILLLFIVACESKDNSSRFTDRWISVNGQRSEAWFQDWSSYTRLFLKIQKDTLRIDPSPYATKTKNKPYLYPKPYNLYEVDQAIGNLIWKKEFSWDKGYENTFSWKVDRSNPKTALPIHYEGLVKNENGRLRLVIKEGDELIFNTLYNPLYYKK